MTITPKDFLTYEVQGNEGIYLCDLEANSFYGRCDCPHFRCKVQPALNRGEKPWPCKHIVNTRMAAWAEIAPVLAKHWKANLTK